MKRIAWAGLMMAGCAPVAPDAPPRLPRERPRPPVAVIAPPAPPVPRGDEGAEVKPLTPCRAEAAADLIGKPLTPTSQQEAQNKARARTVRVIISNAPVTMDYRPDRLNIDVDSGRIIRAVRCG